MNSDDPPLSDTWRLYFHFASDNLTYNSSYATIMTVATCRDWGRMIRWVPNFELIHRPFVLLLLNGRPVQSYSFFKNNVVPEWEDDENRDGFTLTSRCGLSCGEIEALWLLATCDFARGAMNEDILGMQVSKKYKSVKVDFWCSRRARADHMCDELVAWGRQWGLKFSVGQRPL